MTSVTRDLILFKAEFEQVIRGFGYIYVCSFNLFDEIKLGNYGSLLIIDLFSFLF